MTVPETAGERGEAGAPSFVNCEDHQGHQTILCLRENYCGVFGDILM